MYVYDVANTGEFGGPGAAVWKHDSDGEVATGYGSGGKLTGGGSCETLSSVGDTGFLGEFGLNEASPSQIAVDNDPGSPSYRDLYVPSTTFLAGIPVRKFNSAGTCSRQSRFRANSSSLRG